MKQKPKGYIVSCPRIPQGRYFKTLPQAKREMARQMAKGNRESGILEIF